MLGRPQDQHLLMKGIWAWDLGQSSELERERDQKLQVICIYTEAFGVGLGDLKLL